MRSFVLVSFLLATFLIVGAECHHLPAVEPAPLMDEDASGSGGFSRRKPINQKGQKQKVSIIDFYLNDKPNTDGVTLQQMWAFDEQALESKHNYIQWMFPLDKPSGANSASSYLDSVQAKATFANDQQIKAKLLYSFDKVILPFWGFEITRPVGGPAQCVVTKADDFDQKAANWLTKGNHNFLRVTRVLESLQLAGLQEEAVCFFDALQALYQEKEYTKVISQRTFSFWQNALK